MKWKIYITAFVSMLFVSFPANMFGCGGGETDPYDYYISFFHQDLPDAKGYQQFYYTSYSFLYDKEEHITASDLLAQEWAAYCGSRVTIADAKDFVFNFSASQVDSLYNLTKNKKRFKKSDSLETNSMSKYFLQHKDQEALQYINYAKNVQPYVIGDPDAWESISRDSIAMDGLIKTGQQLLNRSKKDFIKLKYGYQLVRLAHYSKRYNDAIEWYDEYIANNKTKTILQSMSLALKAGALYRTGKIKEAALLFSKAYSASEVNRISNYIGFVWSSEWGIEREAYLSYCKTDEEKVSMLILFALTGRTNNELPAIKEIYHLNPGNPILEVLAVREIQKLEETYLTPMLNNKKGGPQTFLYGFVTEDTSKEKKKTITDLSDFLHTIAQKGNVSNAGLFEISAAYASLMIQDYTQAKIYLEAATKMKLTKKIRDQWELTNILLTINSTNSIDAAFEELILPSIKWLEQKGRADSSINAGDYWQFSPWKNFYRNLLSQVMAKKYDAQADLFKEVLVIGASEKIYDKNDRDNYYYPGSILFLHNNIESRDTKKLYDLFNSTNRTAYENYLIHFNTITKNDVSEFMGTVYLRENNYAAAIEWFTKTDRFSIATNPFVDVLYDKVWPSEGDTFTTTKLAFAKEMLRLEKLSFTDKKNVAKLYYKMALGMYNMTYYGPAWSLVQYDRSGNDNYWLGSDAKINKLKNASAFTIEYYSCNKARDYFKKAMDASTDRDFKARCLFMMAKCFQKTVQDNDHAFTNNKYFPQLIKEYGNTSAYQEIFNSCSYLRDFIKKK